MHWSVRAAAGASLPLDIALPKDGERAREAAVGPPVAASNAAPRFAGCLAVLGLAAASRNSLRELRSLRSNIATRVITRRAGARGPRALRSSALHRRRNRQPTHVLATRCGGRCKSVVHMRHPNAVFGWPVDATGTANAVGNEACNEQHQRTQAAGGPLASAPMRRREAQASWPRALARLVIS
jgi:hypothetical protein